MKRAAALLAVLTLVLNLCACDAGGRLSGIGESISGWLGKEEEAEEQTDETEAPAREVTNDINVGIVDFDTYDPLTTKSATVRDVCGFIYEPLFSLDSSMRTIPVLAETYDVSSDGMSLTVYLKQGVKWHDGSELTAYDAVYTIGRIQNEDTNYKSLVEPVSGVWALDNYTLSLSFSRPVPDAPSLLIFPIVKRNSGSGGADYAPMGTGPFYMTGWAGADKYRLAAFEEHHDGRPVLDNVYVIMVPDKEKYVSLFNASELDLATSEMLDMSSFMPKSNANVQDFISNSMVFLGFNTRRAQLTDVGTRRALSMLIDRDSIVTHIYFSRAAAADYAINPQSWLNFDTRSRITADRMGAEQLLRNAGWRLDSGNGTYYREMSGKLIYFNVEIIVNSDSPARVSVAEEIANKFHTVGVNAEVVECSYEEYNARIGAGNYDMFVGETELLPNNDLTPLVGSAGNYFYYSSSEVDTLLQQMGTVKLESDVKAVSISLYEKVRDESPFAPICFMKKSLVSGSKIKYGVNPSISGYVREAENWGVK